MTIVFQNKGALDVRAIKTMGVNVKDSESAIGYFGTGLKYAIAVLLRNGHKISIATDGNTYIFGVSQQTIRGKEFDIVQMTTIGPCGEEKSEELGFTTELGKNWEMWMAYRELYSNTKDERGKVFSIGKSEMTFIPQSIALQSTVPDSTTIFVSGKEIEDIHDIRWHYFTDEREDQPVASFNGIKIYRNINYQEPGKIYYKGVFVGNTYVRSNYDFSIGGDYNVLLTEDRSIAMQHQVRWAIVRSFYGLQSTQKHAIDLFRKILVADDYTYEGALNFDDPPYTPLEICLDVIGKVRREQQDMKMNPSAILLHRKHREKSVLPTKSIELSKVQTIQLQKAKLFCRNALGWDIDEYKLIVHPDIGEKNLGRAEIEEKIMYLSPRAFDQGTKRVAAVLVEEFVHVHYKVYDETIEQKMVYLEKILSLGEELNGDAL